MPKPVPSDLTARDRLVAITLPGACLAQDTADGAQLEAEWGRVLSQAASLMEELQARVESLAPVARGLCAEDAADLLAAVPLPGLQQALAEWQLAARLHTQLLLARQDMPLTGVLLVRAYALALNCAA